MTNATLAQSYLQKATIRLSILGVLLDGAAYSDVVREAQEIVELATKGILRQVGVEPPRWHDVSSIIEAHADRLPSLSAQDIARLARISGWLRKEREFSFYGELDFIPTESYDRPTAERAIADAHWVVEVATGLIPPPTERPDEGDEVAR